MGAPFIYAVILTCCIINKLTFKYHYITHKIHLNRKTLKKFPITYDILRIFIISTTIYFYLFIISNYISAIHRSTWLLTCNKILLIYFIPLYVTYMAAALNYDTWEVNIVLLIKSQAIKQNLYFF